MTMTRSQFIWEASLRIMQARVTNPNCGVPQLRENETPDQAQARRVVEQAVALADAVQKTGVLGL